MSAYKNTHRQDDSNNSNNKNKVYIILVVLCMVGLLISIFIELQKMRGSQTLDNICLAIDENSQCKTVQNSVYARTFNVNNSLIGIFGFFILGAIAFMQHKRKTNHKDVILIFGCIIAGVAAIRFLYLQYAVLHAYCIFCIIVDVISIIILSVGTYLCYRILKKRC